jgi:hypothetical protein
MSNQKPTKEESKKRIKMVTINNSLSNGKNKNYRKNYQKNSTYGQNHNQSNGYEYGYNTNINLLEDYDHTDASASFGSGTSGTNKFDLLTPDEISARLKNYVRVPTDEIDKIPPHSKIQYIDKSSGTSKYRPGGTLHYNGGPKYIVLTNGERKWSVQLHSAVIFKEKDFDEMKKEYEERIARRDQQLDKYRVYVKKQKQVIESLNNKLRMYTNQRTNNYR